MSAKIAELSGLSISAVDRLARQSELWYRFQA
jgi:hypothetical protein